MPFYLYIVVSLELFHVLRNKDEKQLGYEENAFNWWIDWFNVRVKLQCRLLPTIWNLNDDSELCHHIFYPPLRRWLQLIYAHFRYYEDEKVKDIPNTTDFTCIGAFTVHGSVWQQPALKSNQACHHRKFMQKIQYSNL